MDLPKPPASLAYFNGYGQSVSVLRDPFGDDGTMWTSSEEIFESTVDDDIDRLERCLAGGVNVDMQNDEGMTALHFAADRGYLAIVKLLISSGANVNVRDLEGNSPLMLAAACEHEEVFLELIHAGADINLKNIEGYTVRTLDGLSESIAQHIRS